jgi:hypothetical protein
MIDINFAPRPKQMARVAMAEQIDGTILDEVVIMKEKERFWGAVYQNETEKNESVIILWCGKAGKIALKIKWPGAVTGAFNMMGNRILVSEPIIITDDPQYVRINSSSKAVLAAIRSADLKVIHNATDLENILDK